MHVCLSILANILWQNLILTSEYHLLCEVPTVLSFCNPPITAVMTSQPDGIMFAKGHFTHFNSPTISEGYQSSSLINSQFSNTDSTLWRSTAMKQENEYSQPFKTFLVNSPSNRITTKK